MIVAQAAPHLEAVAPAFEQADPNRMSKQQGLQNIATLDQVIGKRHISQIFTFSPMLRPWNIRTTINQVL